MAKTKKANIKYFPDNGYFEVEGVAYIPSKAKYKKIGRTDHIDYIAYEEVDIDAEKKKLDFLKKKMAEKVPRERIIEEALKHLPKSEVDRIFKLVKEKKAKIKREDGCLGLSIDGGKRNRLYLELYG